MADPFAAWGPEASPDRLIRQDAIKEANIMAQTQERLGRIAMQPLEMDIARAKLDVLKTAAEQDKKASELMIQAMQTGAADVDYSLEDNPQARQAVSMADKLDRAANLFAGSGLIKKATDTAKAAAEIRAKADEGLKDRSQAALNQLRQRTQQAEAMAQHFGGATDQASLDLANRLYEFQTGQRSPLSDVPYSPELIESLNQSALSAKERLDLEEKYLSRQNLAGYRKRRLEQFDTENDIRDKNYRLRKDTAERRAKVTGGTGRLPSAEPKEAEIKQVKNLIQRDFPFMADAKGTDASAMSDAAYTVAAEARALMRANPALSTSAAINQAYTSAVRNGDIQADAGSFGGYVGRKFRFAGGGRAPETALAVPSKKEDLKAGRYYVNSKGQIGRWDGKGFTPVQAQSNRSPLSGNNGSPDEEE